MQTFLYDEKTLELFRYLKSHTPKRIFFDEFYKTIFDYGKNHILAMADEFEAVSQNNNDLVRKFEFTGVDIACVPDKNEHPMFSDAPINRLWILRTLLYFTDHEIYENAEQATAGLPNETETDKAIWQITSNATGGHEEVVCHPKSEEVAEVNKDFANLVDVGVVLELDGKFLGCFSYFNSFTATGEIASLKELEEIAECYEFIEVLS
ncbi:MAG: hypothetical protein M3388_16670 [Acidobacteriota bacterium]|nr:hypothetical protein [Acidobacteriota bacterium]